MGWLTLATLVGAILSPLTWRPDSPAADEIYTSIGLLFALGVSFARSLPATRLVTATPDF